MKKKYSTKRALIASVLALCMCFSMLVGTTFAWFTDSVTSANNIIQTGNLDVEMYWLEGDEDPAATSGWNTADTAIFNNDKWEPGYSEAKHIKIANEGTLALKYQMRIIATGVVSELADVIDVYHFDTAKQLTRADFVEDNKLGTLSEVLKNFTRDANGDPAEKTEKSFSSEVSGSLTAGTSKTITLALKMQESAGNEYMNLSIGSEFAIQILATQYTSEEDSFDDQYDKDADFAPQEVPSPMVSIIPEAERNAIVIAGYEDETLDTAYQFEPTETFEQALKSDDSWWHADFAVSADKDVPADSMILAGYFEEYGRFLNSTEWIGLTSSDDIAAGTEIRLIKDGVSQALGGSLSVAYNELCAFGNDGIGFLCGATDLTGVNNGTTLTVELRLYETSCADEGCHHNNYACETGNYITVGTFKYTFNDPDAPIVDTYAPDNAALTDAINSGAEVIALGKGDIKMPSSSTTSNITLVGTKDTVLDVTKGAYMDSANVTIKGVTIKTSTGYVMDDAGNKGSDYAALYSPNITYVDCTFVGPMRVGRDGAKFINCTFTNLGNDYVWTYGNDVTFEGCTFETEGKAILIYSDGGNEVSKVTVKNCKFNATKSAKAGAIANQSCAAIEIHNYGNGVDLVTEGNTIDPHFSGEWRIKTYEIGRTQVFVNGTEYTTIAIDGKKMTIDSSKNVTVIG